MTAYFWWGVVTLDSKVSELCCGTVVGLCYLKVAQENFTPNPQILQEDISELHPEQ